MIGLVALLGVGLVAFLANKGKGAQNLTFGITLKNFGIDSIDFGGIVFNTVFSIDNASNQTYTISNGYFTLRHPNNEYSKAGTATFSGTTTIPPRTTSEVSVKITVSPLVALKILLEYIRVKKAKGYIMKAGIVGTISVLDFPSINIKEEINLFEQLEKVPEMINSFINIFGKAKTTTSKGADNGRNTEVSTNTANTLKTNGTPTTTQKQLVTQGKARSKFWKKRPNV